MEAEIIALSACCRELFPIMDMVSSLTKSVKLPIGKTTMNVSIHEDNSGALVLAKTCYNLLIFRTMTKVVSLLVPLAPPRNLPSFCISVLSSSDGEDGEAMTRQRS
jgi:hypothetical protein